MQIGGIALCNTWGSITYPSQLYMALQNMPNPVQQVWPGMECVISIHTEERLFIGSAPKTIEESFRQSLLMQGYSASNFAKNRRQGRKGMKLPVSKAGARGLKETSTLAKLLRPGNRVPGEEWHIFDLTAIEELLNEEAKNADLASDPKNKALRREWSTRKRLTPIQFLQVILLPKISLLSVDGKSFPQFFAQPLVR